MNFSHSETATIGASTASAFALACAKLLLVPAGAFAAAGGAIDPLGGTVVPPVTSPGAPGAPLAPAAAPLAVVLPRMTSFTSDDEIVRVLPSGIFKRTWLPMRITLVASMRVPSLRI